MRRLKTALFFVVSLLGAFFVLLNWDDVANVSFPGVAQKSTISLGLLIVTSFLAGMVPTMLWYRLSLWSLQRKLRKIENPKAPASAASDDSESVLLARARAAGGAAGYSGDLPVQARGLPVPPAGA